MVALKVGRRASSPYSLQRRPWRMLPPTKGSLSNEAPTLESRSNVREVSFRQRGHWLRGAVTVRSLRHLGSLCGRLSGERADSLSFRSLVCASAGTLNLPPKIPFQSFFQRHKLHPENLFCFPGIDDFFHEDKINRRGGQRWAGEELHERRKQFHKARRLMN